jgi:site-specific recombinase XerD
MEATMKVVYLFYESAVIRIPYNDYGLHQVYQSVVQTGGYWDDVRKEFIFKQDVNVDQFIAIFHGMICVQVMKNAPIQLRILGFQECPWENADNDCPDNQDTPNSVILPQKSPSLPVGSNNLPDAIFKMPSPPSPEKLDETWRIKLETELRARKYSPSTRKAYIYYNCLLCRTLQKIPEEIRAEDITLFLAEMEKERKYSASAMNLAISAVKFFFRNILKNDDISEQHRPRHDGRLPVILSKDEISQILGMEQNPKHRLLLMLVYSSGLRVSEVVALKREHIDMSRHAIYVRLGKGRKDRCTILSEKAAHFIAEYCSFFDIKTWLFPGQPSTRPLTIRSAQHIFDKAVRHAKIPKNISIHSLRHTFATHLLESGTDIRYIQSLLGHANLRTTERYTHVARRSVLSIKSPLDTIP